IKREIAESGQGGHMFGFGGGGCGKGGPGGPGRGGGGPWGGFGRGFGPPWMRGFGGGRFLKDLNLTEEQMEKAAELKFDAMQHFMQLKLSLGGLIRQMVRELAKDKIDKTKIKELGKQMQEKRNQAGDEFLDRIIAFAEVLTPEQRKKLRLKAIKRFLHVDDCGDDEHRHEHEHGHGHGPGPGHDH
ncbi:MAG: Spy/CpxP family protein refolding chaperone, partial [Terriglobales bacterium]